MSPITFTFDDVIKHLNKDDKFTASRTDWGSGKFISLYKSNDGRDYFLINENGVNEWTPSADDILSKDWLLFV